MSTPEPIDARVWLAGRGPAGEPVVAVVELRGARSQVTVARYRDPAVVGGGPNPGAITGLLPIVDVAGGEWLMATVERGRPRLLDPRRAEVVALLGRRREWRGAAASRSAWLDLRCEVHPEQDGPDGPRDVGEQGGWPGEQGEQAEQGEQGSPGGLEPGGRRAWVLAQTRVRGAGGMLDLVRARPGAPLERWRVGPVTGRARALVGRERLVVLTGDRYASVELDGLVPGSLPLTDPRDVELGLRGSELAPATLAVVGLVERPQPALRVIEAEGRGARLVELELDGGRRRASGPCPRPRRWLSAGPWLWLVDEAGVLTRGSAAGVEDSAVTGEPAAWAVERDAAGHPWVWLWRAGGLERRDGLALAAPAQRWAWPAEVEAIQVARLAVGGPGPGVAGDPRTIQPIDEHAELRAVDPTR